MANGRGTITCPLRNAQDALAQEGAGPHFES